MKLLYIEDKYILIYRMVIIIILSLTILVSIIGGLYGAAKWTGVFSFVNDKEIKDNDFKFPEIDGFIDQYKQKESKPSQEIETKVEVEEKKDDTKINKDALFKQQAERLASLQKAFMDEQQKEFADLELTTLKNTVLKLIKKLNVPVLCDKKNEKNTKEICSNKDLKRKKIKSGILLNLDTIDISEFGENFYNEDINYFELQYSFVSKVLTNDITIRAYADGKILTPAIKAINSFHYQFSTNNKFFWKTRAENFKKEDINNRNKNLQKMSDQAEALQIFMYSGGAFGVFISIMIFVIFYRIERNLNKISELNTNVLQNVKK